MEFSCQFADGTWPALGTVYFCYIYNVYRPGYVLNAVNGYHDGDRGNDDVEMILLTGVNMARIPEGLGEFFPNLRAISWSRVNLNTISASDFEQVPNLEVLWLHENKLVTLESDLFTLVPKLTRIDFSGNLLEIIGVELLDNLTQLESANFGENYCVDFYAETPEKFPELIELFSTHCTNESTTTVTTTTTTTTELPIQECPTSCLDHTNQQISFLIEQNVELEKQITVMTIAHEEQQKENEERFAEIERLLRESRNL